MTHRQKTVKWISDQELVCQTTASRPKGEAGRGAELMAFQRVLTTLKRGWIVWCGEVEHPQKKTATVDEVEQS